MRHQKRHQRYGRGKMTTFTLTKTKGYYYYYCYDNGTRRRYSTGLKNYKRAYQYCIALDRNGKLLPNKNGNVLFSEFSLPFWKWETCPIVTDKIERGYHFSQTLCKNNRGSMEKNILPTFGPVPLASITPDMVNTWLLGLKKPRCINGKNYKPLANSTANKMLRMLKDMLEIAVRRGMIPTNPVPLVGKLADNYKKRGTYTIEEANLILRDKDTWSSPLAWLASYLSAFTGMREGEIRALTKEDIKDGYLVVQHSFDVTVGVKCTKGEKERHIPIPEDLRKELLRWAPDEGFIFSLSGGSFPVCPKHLLDGLKQRCIAVGISKKEIERRGLCFHSWRHFFNTRLIASGVTGEITRAVVGHESEDMTERYLHLTASDMEVVARVQNELVKVVG